MIEGNDDEQELLSLIERTYAASLNPAEWTEVASRLGAAFDAPSAFVHMRGPAGAWPLGVTANVDAAALNAYVHHFASVDPWAAGWGRLGGRHGVFLGEELVSPTAFAESEFYRDYARHLGISHQIGATAPVGDDVLLLAVHRPADGSGFTARQATRLGRLLPHMVRARQVQSTLAAACQREHAALAALDLLTLGVVLVRADETITFANTAAEAMLRAGAVVTSVGGRLRTRDADLGAPLRAAIRQAAGLRLGRVSPPAPVLRLKRSGLRPVSLTVSALSPEASGLPPNAEAVVFLADPELIRTPTTYLAELYGLTSAQARMLQALIEGESVTDYAARAAISLNTAQTHLKQIFMRTGTHRQSELIAQSLRNLPGLVKR